MDNALIQFLCLLAEVTKCVAGTTHRLEFVQCSFEQKAWLAAFKLRLKAFYLTSNCLEGLLHLLMVNNYRSTRERFIDEKLELLGLPSLMFNNLTYQEAPRLIRMRAPNVGRASTVSYARCVVPF